MWYIEAVASRSVNAPERVREAIRARLDELGMTQRALCQAFTPPRHDGWLSNILKGRSDLSLDDVDTVADALHIHAAALFAGPEDESHVLSPPETRMVTALRALPPVLADHLVALAEYMIGVLPKDMPQTTADSRLWRKVARLSADERASLERRLDAERHANAAEKKW